jgi:hypothetical protein
VDLGVVSEAALRAADIPVGEVEPLDKVDAVTDEEAPEREGYQIHGKHAPRFTWSELRWVSPAIPIAKEDTLQTIRIPPTLCAGGYLRIDLLGRTQRQDSADGRYYSEFHSLLLIDISCEKQYLTLYTHFHDSEHPFLCFYAACLGYVRCLGKPLYHASLIPPHDPHNAFNPLVVDSRKWFPVLRMHWEESK